MTGKRDRYTLGRERCLACDCTCHTGQNPHPYRKCPGKPRKTQ